MTISRIGGPMLKSNLTRDNVDLAFETDLLYIDVNNRRIGINRAIPTAALDVNGIAVFGTNLKVTGTLIESVNTNGNITFTPNGTGQVVSSSVVNATRFVSNIATGTAPFTVTSTTQVANLNAATAGTVTTAAQPNITSVGTLSSLAVSGTTNLNSVSNVTITGGSNGQVLTTNGSGVLSWSTASGGGGASVTVSDTPPETPSNGDLWWDSSTGTMKIYYNDGSSSQWVEANNTILAATATNAVSANTAETVTNATQPNITSVGTLTSLTVSGATNLNSVSNVTITGGTSGQVLTTDGAGVLSWTTSSGSANTGNVTFSTATISTVGTNEDLTLDPNGVGNVIVLSNLNVDSPITATRFISNVSVGTAPFTVTSTTQVANLNSATAGSATTAGTVTTAAQPNITSLGTLTSLAVNGNVNAQIFNSNIATGTAPFTVQSTTQVANLNSATAGSATTAGTVTTAAQPNITSVGTLTGLAVNGNVNAQIFNSNISTGTAPFSVQSTTQVANLNAATAGSSTTAGTVTTAAQPNITSVGTLTGLIVNGNVNAQVFNSNITTGTAPFTVTSTTQVANLNAATAGSATTAGTVTSAAQPNITSVGTLTSLVVSGTSNLNSVSNVTITGGSNGQVLTTNGSGVLSWTNASNSSLKYVANIGDNTSQFFTVTHSLNSDTVIVAVIENSTGFYVYPDIRISTVNAITVEFETVPTTNQYKIVVKD